MKVPERQLMSILGEAVEYRSPEERAAFLEAACDGDADRRARVEALIRAHEAAGNFLKGAPAGADTGREQPGTAVGPYKLLEPIAEGGKGTVWMAQQTEPVKRLVAVKLIKAGMDSKQVIARFEAERQALALMDHPHIAKVLDAGTTEAGRPYFVMDLVKGVPITHYCDQNRLTPRQRLALFVQVCQAVQHAHQKGIIHRDLKPLNVLVALYDGKPVPKVIDFGVAKAVGQSLTEQTLVTGFGTIVGTLEYMSPEQAEFNQLDIDTRSDVYSLGVLLYELLTGSPPFTRQELEKAGMLEMLRVIREQEPTKPSARLSTVEGLPALASQRGTEPAKLTKLVRGELDWIVMKALEKDRSRRYESASALSEDVGRYLLDQPVKACPPSRGYRLRKFVWRNKAALAGAASAVVALVGAVAILAVSTVLIAEQRDAAREAAVKAERERRRADANFTRARGVVDDWVTGYAGQLAEIPRAQVIRAAMLKEALTFYKGLQQEYATDPAVRFETSQAYYRVGDIHLHLGEGSQAESALREAITLLEKLIADFPNERDYREALPGCYARLGDIYRESGQVEKHREAFGKQLAVTEALAVDYPEVRGYRGQVISCLVTLAKMLQAEDARRDEAEGVFRRAFAVYQKTREDFPGPPEGSDNLAYLHWGYGLLLTRTNRLSEAEKHLRQALQQYEVDLGNDPDSIIAKNWVVTSKADLARLLNKTGRGDEAERLLREATAMVERRVEEFPHFREYRRHLWRYQEAWGLTLFGLNRTHEAEQAFRNGLATHARLVRYFQDPLPGETGDLAWSHYHLGELLFATTRPAAAGEQFRQALRLFEQNAAGFPDVPRYHYHLAWLLAACPDPQLRDPARALRHAQEALRLAPGRAVHWTCLGIARYRSGRWQEAADALEKSRQLDPAGDGFEWFYLALTRWQLGQTEKARQEYEAGVKWLSQNRYADLEVRSCRLEAAALLGVTEKKD